MIEIEDPPTITDCATCASRLSWLYSPKVNGWICVIPIDQVSFRLHPCRHAQEPTTWREIRTPAAPSPEYLAAKAAINRREAS